jgi:hypothetical protein
MERNINSEVKAESTKEEKTDKSHSLSEFQKDTLEETQKLIAHIKSRSTNDKMKYSYILAHLNVTKILIDDLKSNKDLDIHDECKKSTKMLDRLLTKLANQLISKG